MKKQDKIKAETEEEIINNFLLKHFKKLFFFNMYPDIESMLKDIHIIVDNNAKKRINEYKRKMKKRA